MDLSHEYKTSKYEDLKKELEKEGYIVIVKTVEIASTLYQFLSQLGIKGRNRAKCIKRLIEMMEISSM